MRHAASRQLLSALLFACLCVAAMTVNSVKARALHPARDDEQQEGRQGRQRPPAGLSCDRNHTTSFTGRITGYSRTSRRILIRVSTDEQTQEEFTIPLRRGEEASRKFLLQGEAFKAMDWQKIESRRGRLKPNMRATIWACRDNNDDFRAELIDWRPNEKEGSFVL